MSPLVYVVVLNYNNFPDTKECLESLEMLDYDNYNIIIVDNASLDKSFCELDFFLTGRYPLMKPSNTKDFNGESIKDFCGKGGLRSIKLIRSKLNSGYASGNNIGIRHAIRDLECKYLWILNNDTIVDTNALITLVHHVETKEKEGKNYGLVGSKLLFYYSKDIIQCVGGKYRLFFGFPKQIGLGKLSNEIMKVDESKLDYVSGASIFTNRKFIETTGLMNEDYFLYFEELDWAIRGKKNNFLLGYCNESIVYHKDGASTKENNLSILSSPFSDYHFVKSKILFIKKYHRKYLLPAYISFIIMIANRIRRRQLRNIKSILKAVLFQ